MPYIFIPNLRGVLRSQSIGQVVVSEMPLDNERICKPSLEDTLSRKLTVIQQNSFAPEDPSLIGEPDRSFWLAVFGRTMACQHERSHGKVAFAGAIWNSRCQITNIIISNYNEHK